MAAQHKSMTTGEFARASGISSATISKLIRQGKLKAKKHGGRWMIPPGELKAPLVRELGRAAKPTPSRAAAKPAAAAAPTRARRPETDAAAAKPSPASERSYSVADFAAMTYFTEKGVLEWLRARKLKGRQLENGEWRVLASNLETPAISRLVRK
jgi:excisionase family DNA binding protein